MKKVHIGGVYYGAHNVGDEAILSSIIQSFECDSILSVSSYDNKWINEKFPGVEVNKIVTNYSKPLLGMYANPKRNPFLAKKNIQKDKKMYSLSDLYICGGATILSDCPWYSLRTVQLAQNVGTKCILFGVGMAEIKDKKVIPFIKKVCNSLNDIYVRDNFVKRRLIDIGVNQNKIKVCYDSALALQQNSNFEIDRYLDNEGINKYNNEFINIGITLSGEEDIINRTPINDINEIINSLVEKYKANIFLIPTNTRRGQDIDLMSKLKINDKVILIKNEFSPEDLISFMNNFSFVISSRLHMNILSSIVGIPSIGLVRNSKIIDFSKLLELKCFNLDEIDTKGILDYSDYLIKNNNEVKNNIISKTTQMKKVHIECVNEIKDKYIFN